MSITLLEQFLPQNSSIFIQKWLKEEHCHIRITKNRESKLGDYKPLREGGHQITINSTLEPIFFFFVLTHELAHLITFVENRKVLPHGKEWKQNYRNMLLESIHIYPENLQPLIINFSKSPKANFMANPELVRYFYSNPTEDSAFIDDFCVGSKFRYRKHEYLIEERRKKTYLCKNLHTGRKFIFKSCARVEKVN